MREAVDGDGQREQARGERRERAAAFDLRRSQDERRDERGRAAEGRDPRRERGTAVLQRVAEVAGPERLEDDAGREPERDDERAEQAGEHREPAREREREGEEAGGAP